MKLRAFLPCFVATLLSTIIYAQDRRPAIDSQAPDGPDSSTIAQIIEEGTARSHVMELLS